MPLLGPGDELPYRPQRVIVSGTSGSGKSTVARRIAETIGVPYTELDSLFHGPGWTARPTFEAEVDRFTQAPAWATEWQYTQVRPRLAERADLMVWLDLPRWLVMYRVTRRTLTRRLRRQQLWNGNREGPLRTIVRDPEHIIRWAWSTHGETAERTRRIAHRLPGLPVVRLRSRREVEAWLSGPLRRYGGTPAPPR